MTSKIDEINRKICLKIKMERIKRNWSQEVLSEKCAISKNSIGAIERMQSTPSTISLAKRTDF